MKVYVESKDQIVEKPTDDRGRVYLGQDLADRKNVQLAILDTGEPKSEE